MSLKPVCEKASAKCLCGRAGAKVVNARTVPKISCLNQSIRPTVLMELLKLILPIRLLIWTTLYHDSWCSGNRSPENRIP